MPAASGKETMRTRACLAVMMFALFTVRGRADYVAYTINPVGNQYLYSFTLTNTGSTALSLHSLTVTVPNTLADIDTGSITSPLGWDPPGGGTLSFGSTDPGTSFVNWGASTNGAYDVQIGQSLGGFSFLANRQISGPILFDFGSADPGTDMLGSGPLLDPGAPGDPPLPGMPEPSSLILFGIVGFALLARGIYEKRRKRIVRDGTPD